MDRLFSLQGRVALISGASSGIGLHIAGVFAQAGAVVALAARRREKIEAAAQALTAQGHAASAVYLDVTDPGSIGPAFDAAEKALGAPVDILFNNAGVLHFGSFVNQDPAEMARIFDTNLKGSFLVAREAARRMARRERGVIINVASTAGLRAGANVSAYGASKAGLIHLSAVMALELAHKGIRVNTLCPGNIDTDMHEAFRGLGLEDGLIRRIPQGRIGSVEDLDGAALLLAADAGRYITGAIIAVDGGQSLELDVMGGPGPMAAPLAGKIALVTGGASGIGAACAQTLAAQGAVVMIADLDAAKAEQRVAEIVDAGGEARATLTDVADPVAVAAMVEHTVKTFGRLDIAVNNAGVSPQPVPLHRIAVDDWRRVVDINLSSLFYCMRHEVPAMLASRGGAIVNMASVLGTVGGQGLASYVAAKHGVIGLTRAAALDYATSGIRVNAVCPAFVDSPLLREEAAWELVEAYLKSLHPVRRLGKESEVAEMVAFLVSDRAAFITGGSYLVDGGYTAQ